MALASSSDEHCDLGHSGSHVVQFYESEGFLVRSVAEYVSEGLRLGEAIVVIATAQHIALIRTALEGDLLNLAELEALGHCRFHDAHEALASFVIDGRPDPVLFAKTVGDIITRANHVGRVRAFGEMVAVLWAEGNQSAAIEVERLWNLLAEHSAFSLLCAYPITGFADSVDMLGFREICDCHSDVRPAESFLSLADPDQRLRAISLLQQRAQSLELEIARRKKVEVELARREQELSDFLENAVEGLHKVAADGTILWANRAELEMLGYPAEEYIGRPIWKFHLDADVIADILARLGRGEALHNYPARLRASDGSARHVLISSNVHFENGQFLYTRCFTRDVTERRRAEETLRANEERVRRLLDLLPAAVYTCEAPSGKIQFYNRRAAELWGREPDESSKNERFCGSLRLFDSDNKLVPHSECPMANVLAGGPPVRDQEVHVERPDGSRVTIVVNIDPILDPDGTVVGAVNVFQDITARKTAEEDLRQAKATAEESSRAKDRFLAVLSHELRTPLTPVLMAVSALEKDTAVNPRVRAELAMMHRNIALEIRLIDDLLDLNRIASGKLVFHLDTRSVHPLIESAIGMVDAEANARGVEIKIDLAAQRDVVSGDPARLQQVFWNLLHNAVKFTPSGGNIVVRSRDEEDTFVMEVADTGIGIPSAALSKVFDAFAQGEDACRQSGGLGLGLAIARAVIEGHQGHIEAYSDGSGRGSQFTVRLPRAVAEEGSADEMADEEKKEYTAVSRRILLVDDHKDTLLTMRRLLGMSGYDVTSAGSVREACDHLGAGEFDMLICDLGLPDGSGVDVVSRARARFPRLPAIVLTGYGMEKDVIETGLAGFDEHLVKPVDIDKLCRAILRLLAEGRDS